ncbi:MAG: MFS transporter [Candidatus Aminicenantes bacterium]|nr:MFS transporter [Candidatus Aminicenantes bacterium]
MTLFLLFPLFLRQFQPSRTRMGLIMGVHSLVAVSVRPLIGRLTDLRGRRTIALAGTGLVAAVVPFFHLIRGADALPLALRAMGGLGWGVGMTATMALASDHAPRARLAHSMGIIGVAGLVAHAVGPVLGEEIVLRFGFGGLFNVSLLLALLALGGLVLVRDRERPAPAPAGASPAAALLKAVGLPVLLVMASMPVVHGATKGAIDNFIALFGRAVGFGRVGPFFLAFSLAAILTRAGLGDLSDRVGRKRVIGPAAAVISLNLLLLSQVRGYPLYIAAGFLGGLGQGFIFPALSTYVIDVLGSANRGLAISLYLTLFDIGNGLGGPVFGAVSDLAGYRFMYAAAGALMLSAGVLFALKAPPSESFCKEGSP